MKQKILKHAIFEWSPENKILKIRKETINSTGDTTPTIWLELHLTRSEMGSLSRFIFSMFQFYSRKPKADKSLNKTIPMDLKGGEQHG